MGSVVVQSSTWYHRQNGRKIGGYAAGVMLVYTKWWKRKRERESVLNQTESRIMEDHQFLYKRRGNLSDTNMCRAIQGCPRLHKLFSGRGSPVRGAQSLSDRSSVACLTCISICAYPIVGDCHARTTHYFFSRHRCKGSGARDRWSVSSVSSKTQRRPVQQVQCRSTAGEIPSKALARPSPAPRPV
ncbi:hypothetical protein CH063_11048, partial [Colletotrichum higginsianum]